ncbi:MAG: archaemetzincin family Zn-dependent metalloprotease [Bryobacterales bacterium]|nr:archaemetzincin family Zn-dependent metalloprotease [Bryobacterales bacterium]
MESVTLVAVTAANTAPDMALLDRLASRLAPVFHLSITVSNSPIDAAFAYTPERCQYYSTRLVAALAALPTRPGEHILGITPLDLFVPILTFVFGEAQLRGPAAIVSYHRLTEEFYGLPADAALLDQRLLKEAVHELGHTLGLRHCDDWSCAMASTHTVELLDLKGAELCPHCRRE